MSWLLLALCAQTAPRGCQKKATKALIAEQRKQAREQARASSAKSPAVDGAHAARARDFTSVAMNICCIQAEALGTVTLAIKACSRGELASHVQQVFDDTLHGNSNTPFHVSLKATSDALLQDSGIRGNLAAFKSEFVNDKSTRSLAVRRKKS